jgi:hypothetical protein
VAGYVTVRAYAELNDFLAPESRGLTLRQPFRTHQTVKDVLEAMGIPHTEIDLILVNGDAKDFGHRPSSGDRIAAYPVFEAFDIGSTARLRPGPLLGRHADAGQISLVPTYARQLVDLRRKPCVVAVRAAPSMALTC